MFDRSGWTASADSETGSYTADKAINASFTDRWGSGSGYPHFLTVNLGSVQTFNLVLVTFYDTDFPATWELYTSDDNSNWGSALASGSAASAALKIIRLATPASGRYVKFVGLTGGTNYLSITDIQIFNAVDLTATTPTAVADTEYSAGYAAPYAIDGVDYATRWASSAASNYPHYLTVDFGIARTFNILFIDFYTGQYPATWEVYVSDDGATWGSAIATGSTGADFNFYYLGTAVTKRYVKFVGLTGASTYMSIWEFRAYLVRDRTSWSMSADTEFSGSYAASKAIDGDLTTRWASGNGVNYPHYLTIDMGSSQQVDGLIFFNYLEYADTWEIYVSSDGSTWGTAIKTGSGDAFAATARETHIRFDGPVTTRYVKFSGLTGAYDQYLSIFEVWASYRPTTWSIESDSAFSTYHHNAALLDADSATRWSSCYKYPYPHRVILNIGESAEIDGLVVLPYEYPATWEVYVSDDGLDWGSDIASGSASDANPIYITFDASVTTQYVMFKGVTDGNVNSPFMSLTFIAITYPPELPTFMAAWAVRQTRIIGGGVI